MAGSQHDIPLPPSLSHGWGGGGEVTLPGGKWRTAPYTPEQTIEHKIYHKKFPYSSQYTHCLFPPPSTPPLFCLSFMFSRKLFCSFFHLAKKDLFFSSSFLLFFLSLRRKIFRGAPPFFFLSFLPQKDLWTVLPFYLSFFLFFFLSFFLSDFLFSFLLSFFLFFSFFSLSFFLSFFLFSFNFLSYLLLLITYFFSLIIFSMKFLTLLPTNRRKHLCLSISFSCKSHQMIG